MVSIRAILLTSLLTTSCRTGTSSVANVGVDSLAHDTIVTALCPPSVLRQFSGRNAKLDPVSLVLEDDNQVFAPALKGPSPADQPNRFRNATLSDDGFPSAPSIRYELTPCESECNDPSSAIYMQKVNHHFLYRDNLPSGLAFGERRYIGFAFKYEGELPHREIIVFQLWQGSPFSPPFAAVLNQQDHKLHLKFEVRNQDTGSNPSATPLEIGRISDFKPGSWYQFVLNVFPENDSMSHRPGNTTLELAAQGPGAPEFSKVFSYHGKFGYSAGDSCHYSGHCNMAEKPNSTLDFKMGLYRHSDSTLAIARFDTVRLASTFEAARPSYECEIKI